MVIEHSASAARDVSLPPPGSSPVSPLPSSTATSRRLRLPDGGADAGTRPDEPAGFAAPGAGAPPGFAVLTVGFVPAAAGGGATATGGGVTAAGGDGACATAPLPDFAPDPEATADPPTTGISTA